MQQRTSDHPRRALVLGLVALAASACAAAADDLAIINVELAAAPDAPRVTGTTVVIRDGRIAEVGTSVDTSGIETVDGGGRLATAGLWNCHVHLTDPALAADPAPILRDMLLRYGVTSMVDTGSDPGQTQRIASAIETGDFAGPRIVTANGSFVFTNGTPAYLPGIKLPEIATPEAAAPAVNAVLDAGADGIKIFSGSFKSPTQTVLLPPAVIEAITTAAHARGSFVIAHPTDRAGLENAVRNGVDVLAHTAPPAGPLGPELVQTMLRAHVALIPTLKLWSWELARFGAPPAAIQQYQDAGVGQLAEYRAAGGEILFGTDVGYMRDYDTRDEFELMARAGMGFSDILAALTTAPAKRFGHGAGKVETGAPGDLVVFEGDPAADPAAWSRVAMTVREGRVVYRAEDWGTP
jgi:imidazolonepropionase-like amidohydrolase